MSLIPNTPPLPLGTLVRGLGKVVGIRSEGGELGERYYFLRDDDGTISFMPANAIEGEASR